MRLKPLAEATMWLPGFGPDENPLEIKASNDPVAAVAPAALPPEVVAANAKCSIMRTPRPVASPKQVWSTLHCDFLSGLAGPASKFEANVAAIELLRKLEDEGRKPDEAERSTLNLFTGWGGQPEVFNRYHRDPAVEARANRLSALLSEAEYEAARASTPNAHFTSHDVISGIWKAVERMGFKGGRVLEPAAGVGYFIGAMPKKLAERSTITAIELESMSARMLKSLYGHHGVKVQQCGFEDARLPADFFDLVISNVPFGNYQVGEKRSVPFRNFAIHDYFFAKALEVVRPGGIVACITSRFTMDKAATQVRQYLGSQAEFLGAIRLPSKAFQKVANTEVTTDVIFLRKRDQVAEPTEPWTMVTPLEWDHPLRQEAHAGMIVNRHFADNPEWVIGKMGVTGGAYGAQLNAMFDGDLAEALDERVAKLPTGVYTDRAAEVEVETRTYFAASADWIKPGAYVIHDDKVAVSHGHQVEVVEDSMQKAKATRIRSLIPVRDALRQLVAAQASTEDDAKVDRYREKLNLVYSAFVKRFGYISERMNASAFRKDPDFPLLLSLEKWDEETRTAEKAPIFTTRTVGMVKRVDRCETSADALLVCLGERGRIVPHRIGELMELDADEVMGDLVAQGVVFLDPETMNYVPRDEYLSSNVRLKLLAAEEAGEGFVGNAEALRAVVPQDLLPGEITVRLGATWVPAGTYLQFIQERLSIGGESKVALNKLSGNWSVTTMKYGVSATQTWGTSRVSAGTLMEMAMNQQTPTCTDPDPDDPEGKRRIANATETVAATEKQNAIKEAFVEWLWADAERAALHARIYNDEYNSLVTRKYDGRHLTLPGFSMAYTLREHQLGGVWRVIASRDNTLLAHAVGAGKTLTMICAGMEMRRMGLASKPCYAVPNHMLEQFGAEFLRAYPTANVLLASKEDMAPSNRQVMLSRIAMGDWDAVVITHSSFEKIQLPVEYTKKYIKEVIAEQDLACRMEEADGNTKLVKQIEKQKKVWEARLTRLMEGAGKDEHLTFDELGVDFVQVDEAHYFKNVYRFSRLRMAGLPTNDSLRAYDMLMKTRYVMDKRGDGKGVVFATGTPIANSVAEMWVMQNYLQPRTLKRLGLDMFDAWAANFGEPVTALELSPDGSSYRLHTRFARFVNVPELMALFREVADIQTAEMMKLPVPEHIRVTVTAKPSALLKSYVEMLVERADRVKQRLVKPTVDNMLKVTTDGRKAATDLRLVGIDEDAPGSKINLSVDNILRDWEDTASFKGAQLVFLDMGTPSTAWSLYGDMKAKLIARGIPEHEVAFIHDADTDKKKEALFQATRSGRVRVLFGSTAKMGVGTNVQERLASLHHIDGPWRPADVEQREGRIIRQGNTVRVVKLYRYVTEGSFDAYVWQTLETKAKFIAQVMSGDNTIRTLEDAELAALSYAEVKALASGNPLVIEKAGVDAEVMKLSMLASKHQSQQRTNQFEMADLPGRISRYEGVIEAAKADVESYVDTSGDRFRIELDGKVYTDREEAGKRILGAAARCPLGQSRSIGKLGAFIVDIVAGKYAISAPNVRLNGKLSYEADMGQSALGVVRRLEYLAANEPSNDLDRTTKRLATAKERLEELRAVTGSAFEQGERLAKLMERQQAINRELGVYDGDGSVSVDVDMAKAA